MSARAIFLTLSAVVVYSFACEAPRQCVTIFDVQERDLPKPYGRGVNQPFQPSRLLLQMEAEPDSMFRPARAATYGLICLDSLNATGKRFWLESAFAFASLLAEHACSQREALFFPYRFEWFLHGAKSLRLAPPWVSALGQGLALALLSRLASTTGKSSFALRADSTFQSLVPVEDPCAGRFWVAYVDSLGTYWLEEYPWCRNPTHVLNGYVSAVYGLYEYWKVRKAKETEALLQKALDSLKRILPLYRNKDSYSSYCLAHRITRADYHQVHIDQMSFLFAVTLDSFFSDFREKLIADQRSAMSRQ